MVTPSFPGFRDGLVDVQVVVPLSVKLLEVWLKLMEKCKDSEEEDWNEELTGLIDKSRHLLRRVYEDPTIVQLYACRGED